MKTYQDLEKAQSSQRDLGILINNAITAHRSSVQYKQAVDGMAYYNKHNITMEHYQKFLYTISGRKIPDMFSSDYRLKSLIFRRLVVQEVQYVLGNGVNLKGKDKLGIDFDFQMQKAAKMALAQGRAYAYWNLDHVEVFSFADTENNPGFVPLLDEKSGELKAGIRYWFRDTGDGTVLRATLYEEDGVSEWVSDEHNDVVLKEAKRAYKIHREKNDIGIIEEQSENYTKLPIVTLLGNDTGESELVGVRESIDCYDFIKSGLANQIDDTSGFYWVLKNSGGMEDTDLAQFIQRMKTVKAAVVDSEEGQSAEAHTLEVPFEARKTMLDILRSDIYEDFQMLDVKTISSAAKTATEINASYQPQDNKCADFEYFLIDFIQGICELAGIQNAMPEFSWNKIINEPEITNMVLAARDYLDDGTVLKHLPFILPDEIDEILKTVDAESLSRFGAKKPQSVNDEEEEEEEDNQLEE